MSKYVVIGNSTAGLSAVQALKLHDPNAGVTVVSAERHLPYSRVLLTHLIAGKVNRRQLFLVEPDFYLRSGIRLLEGLQAVEIAPLLKLVTLDSGEQLSYHKLLVSAGSAPVIPAGFNPSARLVTGLRTLEDAEKVLRFATPEARIVVVGGGPVGVKLACALREAGAAPELIVGSPQLLSQVADDETATIVRNRISGRGVRVRTGVEVICLEDNRDGSGLLSLSDGTNIYCNLVVFCKGVSPNAKILHGLLLPGRWIRVDKRMRTEYEDIYAAGDVAETFEITRRQYCVAATWPHAVQQGRLAGMNMAGFQAAYSGSLFRNAMEIFGLPFISIGIHRVQSGANWDVLIRRDGLCYRKLVYRDGKLVGVQLVGDVREAGALQAEIRRGAVTDELEISALQEGL